MIKNKEEIKKRIIGEIISSKGFKTIACANLDLNPRTFRSWMAEDAEFRQAVEDAVDIARDYRDDVAEQKLFKQVEAGDTTAIIFYCKTRLKGRGYTERVQLQPVEPSSPKPALASPGMGAGVRMSKSLQGKITAKRSYIVKLLKEQGKYTPELSMQVKLVAQLLVRTEILAEEIFDTGHQAVTVEVSREGHPRESVSPKERLYLDFLQQSQRALRALGMNTDSKERKTDNDGFNEFLKNFSEE